MYLTIRGLVLRITQYNDSDVLLTLLTSEHGNITVKVRGLRRKNSPMIAPCQLLAYSEFTLFEYKGMYTVNEARTIELFQSLRRDLSKLSLATYFAQVAEVLSQGDFPDTALLSLTLNCMYALSNLGQSEEKVKAVFELRSACLAGYAPELSGCHRCGQVFADRFDISQGRLECKRCRDNESAGIRLPLNAGALDAIRYICSVETQRMFSFEAGEETMSSLAAVAEGYLAAQLERGFSSLDFYKSIQ